MLNNIPNPIVNRGRIKSKNTIIICFTVCESVISIFHHILFGILLAFNENVLFKPNC